jgi:phosphoglycerol transferase MdoB-like AlkP superfamily enzyme
MEEGEMTEYVVRFIVGGALVSAFAMIGDVLRPKSFAGLFGAAPSVALATLGIAVYQHGAGYAAVQSQAMLAGALALVAYSVVVCHLLIRTRLRALPATLLSLFVWLIVAFGVLTFAGGQT